MKRRLQSLVCVIAGIVALFNIASGQSVFKVKGTTSDSLVVVNDNGKVGIGTANPSEKLEVSGNLKVTGSVKLNTTTRYLTIGAGAFTPWQSQFTDYHKERETLFGLTGEQTMVVFATINLPHGATVTDFSATVTDTSSSRDIVVIFESDNIYFACTSSGTPGVTTLTPITATPGIVDNSNYTYFVRATWVTPLEGNMGLKLHKVKITYTIDSLP